MEQPKNTGNVSVNGTSKPKKGGSYVDNSVLSKGGMQPMNKDYPTKGSYPSKMLGCDYTVGVNGDNYAK